MSLNLYSNSNFILVENCALYTFGLSTQF